MYKVISYLLLAYQSAKKGVFKFILILNTNWIIMAYNLVWYVLRISKAVATRIPYQGSSSSS